MRIKIKSVDELVVELQTKLNECDPMDVETLKAIDKEISDLIASVKHSMKGLVH